jgi:arylformamidase
VISGLYDLEPVRLCHPNEWARLDAEGARRLSPIHHLPDRGCPLIVAWAEADTDEFRRQSRAFAEAWAGRGFPCERIEMAGFNHFDIVLELNRAESPLAAAVLRQMGLSRAGTPAPR